MRLITFGCSFTDYAWPTWADIIARDRGCDYENWAMGGGGNQQIARRVLYRMTRGFQPQDMVMIQWTSITREDRFIQGHWRCEGSVALSATYQGQFLKQHWDWDNDVINTAHSRITTQQLLHSRLKYQMAMSWQDGDLSLLQDDPTLTDYWLQQLPAVDQLPSGVLTLQGKTADGHPDPQWWLQWVQDRIYPQLGWQLKPQTRRAVMDIQQYIQQLADQGCPHNEIQRRSNVQSQLWGWPGCKVKPHSDTLTPGAGSDVLM